MGYTADDVRARVAGSRFFAGFGSAWLFSGLGFLHRVYALSVVLVVAFAGCLIAAGSGVRRRAGALPEVPVAASEQAGRRRAFGIANIAQYAAMPVVCVALILWRLPEYILPAIAVIVGLHLLPLARAFRYPPHYATGAAAMLWSLGCMVVSPRRTVAGHAALGNGVILFVSAAVMLAISARAIRGARFVNVTKAADF